jgi:hypothetical protein
VGQFQRALGKGDGVGLRAVEIAMQVAQPPPGLDKGPEVRRLTAGMRGNCLDRLSAKRAR